MNQVRKFLTAGLMAATFAAGIMVATPASARGRGGWSHGGFGHGGWRGGGWGRGGWSGGGWGYGSYGGGWGNPGWGYDGYGYGAGLAGAAIGAAAIGAIAAGAAQQNQYDYGYSYPPTQYYYGSVRAPSSRRGRTCIQTGWDALQGYVQVRVRC